MTPGSASCSSRPVTATPTRRSAAATASARGDRSGEPTSSSAAAPPATPSPKATTRSRGRLVPEMMRTTAKAATTDHSHRVHRGPSHRTSTTTAAAAPAR